MLKRGLIYIITFLFFAGLVSVRLISNAIDDYYMSPEQFVRTYKDHTTALKPKYNISEWELLGLQALIRDRRDGTTNYRKMRLRSVVRYKHFTDARLRRLRKQEKVQIDQFLANDAARLEMENRRLKRENKKLRRSARKRTRRSKRKQG